MSKLIREHYSEEEDQRLLKLYDLHSDKKYTDIARLALDLGVIKNSSRTVNGVAQHLIKLTKPEEKSDAVADTEETEKPINWDEAVLRQKYHDLERKYENLMVVLIDRATLYKKTTPYGELLGLSLKLPLITNWLRDNEADRVEKKIKELTQFTDEEEDQ